MKAILSSWWEVVKTLGYLFRLTLRLFWRDPTRMLYAAWLNTLGGDKEEAQRQIKKIEEKL